MAQKSRFCSDIDTRDPHIWDRSDWERAPGQPTYCVKTIIQFLRVPEGGRSKAPPDECAEVGREALVAAPDHEVHAEKGHHVGADKQVLTQLLLDI